MPQASDWPPWLTDWPEAEARQRFSAQKHGDYPRWQLAIDEMPAIQTGTLHLSQAAVGCDFTDASAEQIEQLERCLQALHPGVRGPFSWGPCTLIANGVRTGNGTDWRPPWGALDDQRILDIGCGNGYFGWRMLGAGAEAVVGIDPTLVFCMQHRAMQRLLDHPNHWVLPLGVEEVTATHRFDWVLSMGVLYHRKNPREHLKQMYGLTEEGGRCVMETLVVDAQDSLYPNGCYARMRNIGVIPNLVDLRQWMVDAGYQNIELIDLSPTTTNEQRSTPWMRFESLDKSLDPHDASLTVEGLPAPLRAMLVGTR